MLTATEMASYQEHGYVVPEFRLPPDRVLKLREAMDRVIAANPATRPEQLVSIHIDGRNAEGVAGDSEFLAVARDEAILDMVEQCIGPDVILWGCQAFCKPSGDGMEVPWHQDGHYWPIRPLATCTVWIAIDDSVVENGCLRVIPGSHRERLLWTHEKQDRSDIVLNQSVADARFNESTAVDVELQAGQMSLHDVYLAHGSNPNLSTRRRAGLAIRYMPGTSLFDRDPEVTGTSAGYTVDFSTRPIWLLRGEDQTGRNDFEAGHRRAETR
ncbi:MAG: phytanoyl-CoA dioxygenase family protein [Planctomycetes bacterium]|nr:phytanoyl-CoA dioxygenase family protein [Planctomycetota bacterium]